MKPIFRTITLLLPILLALSCAAHKREFRGAWLHTVYQSQYARQTTAQNKEYLRKQLDALKAAGVNAVIFQVRPSADAFYPSTLEPWSRFLSGTAGKAPSPGWDPLQFMIDETHARGMELHAWLNPYRVTTSKNESLPAGHLYRREPERFVKYADGKIYFDPGLPENRSFILQVVADIVGRYDVDGIHFDDYFYPYPVGKAQFPDDKSYKKYGSGLNRNDWRRKNVDLLIEEVHNTIRGIKPWVRFGVSPFGIWRNRTSDARGSDTRGLENYDSLYADVLLWAHNGWVDYLMPQLYWELDHKAASYRVLAPWWDAAATERHIYIGQDVERTMKTPDAGIGEHSELTTKLKIMANGSNTQGLCWWPGYSVSSNFQGVADSLATKHHPHTALVPEYPWISDKKPQRVENLTFEDGNISWKSQSHKGSPEDAVKFVVYRFDGPTDIDLDNAAAIAAVTEERSFTPREKGVYIVTALSRTNVESKPSRPVVVEL